MDQRNKCLGLDLKEAFDIVSIPLLLRKAEGLDIRGTALDGRMQKVKVSECTSKNLNVTHSILQGKLSTLGPTVFLVYANKTR
ncbi:unnamed protein product [Leptidea sinapis]|uniref:Reverse transcriptase domain-containing protein n=1 Tax=Leptidea sinapis TaxID=189913 RepID=A0A5E4QTA9_9NEOP|nr:unnamed protein product [Leptidea sinapis]